MRAVAVLGPLLGAVSLVLLWPGCVDHAPRGGWSARDIQEFRNNTHWSPPVDVTLLPAPGVDARALWATSVNVGDVKIIEGDSTNVSPVNNVQGTGWGLRMDEGRQDLARLTAQVLAEEGDRFDFVVVFPAFQDLLNPGVAYFSLVQNADTGVGLNRVDQTRQFGSNGRLQGFINMNRPAAYQALDGRPISDPQSGAFAIMGQEMTHRWLAYARFQRPDVNGGLPTALLLGRDNSHWSALMHTGPVDPDGADPGCSVQDGVSWRDNGNGTFTAVDVFADPQFALSPRARFSALDLYFMGMLSRAEVDPFFVITNGRLGSQLVPSTSRLPRGVTITGNRLDITMEHIVDAMGPRVPGSAEAQHDFSMAVVVLTAPGQTANDVMGQVAEVDAFRVQWEERFQQWTGGRGSLCTSLSGVCQRAPLALEEVTFTEDTDDGVWVPGERLTVSGYVHNPGGAPSDLAAVNLLVQGAAYVSPTTQLLGSVPAGERVPLHLEVTPLQSFHCGDTLRLTVTLTASGSPVQTASLERRVGVRQVASFTMEDTTGFILNPDAADSATAGQWRAGIPHRTDLGAQGYPSVVFQPDQDTGDPGSNAFFTDPGDPGLLASAYDATDVDDGTTSMQFPTVDLSGSLQPVLNLALWHASALVDLQAARVDPSVMDDLVVLGRMDEGRWVELVRVSAHVPSWQYHQVALWDVPLLGAAQGGRFDLRVVARDDNGESVVEAGVDDVTITSAVAGCVVPSNSSSLAPAASSSSGSGGGSQGGSAGSSTSNGPPLVPPWTGPCACAGVPVAHGVALGWALAGLPVLLWRRRGRGACGQVRAPARRG